MKSHCLVCPKQQSGVVAEQLCGASLAPQPSTLNIHMVFSLLVAAGPSVHPGVCQAALPGIQSPHIEGKASSCALCERAKAVVLRKGLCE